MYYLDSCPKTSAMAFVCKIARVGFLCLYSTLLFNFVHGQAVQLADIGQYESIDDNEYSDLTNGIGRMFFVGFKSELWTSRPVEGDSNETRLIKRFNSIS